MNVDLYTSDLKTALGEKLCSVILYGSAAGVDYHSVKSDLNLLVLCHHLGTEELKAAAKVSKPWTDSGQVLPLFMTRQSMIDSADVFPVEMLDIRESRRVLFGEDVPVLLEISPQNLRHQLEFELKSKLIRLRSRYLVLHAEPEAVCSLMLESKTGFLVLFRAILRLFNEAVPPSKLEALPVLAAKWNLDTGIISELEQLDPLAHAPKAGEMEELFRRYLELIEIVVNKVNGI